MNLRLKGKTTMTTQKQIKEWIPEALSSFQSIMPPISTPYPEIQIARTLLSVEADAI